MGGGAAMSNTPPADPAAVSPEMLANAAKDMACVLAREPLLTDFGFREYGARCWTPDVSRLTEAEYAARVERERAEMRDPRSLAAFIAARIWLRQFRKLKSFNRRGSSYGLKHVAEADIGYLTNGVFIAAAMAEGFRIERDDPGSPNVVLNISQRAWGRGWMGGDQESWFDEPYERRLAAIGETAMPVRGHEGQNS
jgi:hypothetical protein